MSRAPAWARDEQPTLEELSHAGMREEVAVVQFAALLEALEEDAIAIRSSFGPETASVLGLAEPPTPLTEAMWDADIPADWKKEQLEKARGLLPWSRHPNELSESARDFRE